MNFLFLCYNSFMNQTTHLTPAEYFQQTGAIHQSHAEILLDAYESGESVADTIHYVEDAKSYFPQHDFLDRIIDDLQDLKKRLRGDNKETLDNILDKIDQLVTNTIQATEEGLDNLNKFTNSYYGR